MITAFMSANEQHAVYVIRREGMAKIRAMGFCGVEDDAGPGVYQVPEWAFDGRPVFRTPGSEIPVCAKCANIMIMLKTPQPK